MEIKRLEETPKEELSLIEVAYALLKEDTSKQVQTFDFIQNSVKEYLGLDEALMVDIIAQFYTDLNIDGRFISLGDNRWGLREWYAVDEIDEEVNHFDDDMPRRKKRKQKVNVFMENDEDNINYNDDDPEDNDFDSDASSDDLYHDDTVSEYSKDMEDIDDAEASTDDKLTVIDDSDLHNDDDEQFM